MGKSLIIKGADFSENGIVPDFKQLKCIIAAARTQWIASPIDFGADARCVAEMAVPAVDNTAYSLFGYNHIGSPNTVAFNFVHYKNKNNYNSTVAYVNSSSMKKTTSALSDGLKHVLDVSRTSLKIDNTTTTPFEKDPNVGSISANNFGLFGIKTSQPTNPSYPNAVTIGVKLYSIKIYSDENDENSLVLDAIPVKRTADNVICLYDRISDEYLLTSDGTNPGYEDLD